MTIKKITDEEVIDLWKRLGSATLIIKYLATKGIIYTKQSLIYRRLKVEKKYNIVLLTHNSQRIEAIRSKYSGRLNVTLTDGMCLIFSDAHYLPNESTTAHRALLKFIDQFHPELIICNGDAFDGGSISRYPRIGWDNKPTVAEEIKAVKERLGEIEDRSKGKLLWLLGNHDARYETFLASHAPQYEGMQGFSLKDHFPRWMPAWSAFINNDVVVKHRFKGGIHATHNNTLWSGKTIVTGHLHSLKVTPFTDYNSTRYGIDSGTLARPEGPQFSDYTENNPTNWRSGFVVLSFRDSMLLPPELVQVWDEDNGQITFRGDIISV